MSASVEEIEARFSRFLKPWLVPFWRSWRRWTPPSDHHRLMADLRMDGDTFYEFAEAFAAAFCPQHVPPPPGPRGYVEICPPDLTIAEWKAIARGASWPADFWMVA